MADMIPKKFGIAYSVGSPHTVPVTALGSTVVEAGTGVAMTAVAAMNRLKRVENCILEVADILMWN